MRDRKKCGEKIYKLPNVTYVVIDTHTGETCEESVLEEFSDRIAEEMYCGDDCVMGEYILVRMGRIEANRSVRFIPDKK